MATSTAVRAPRVTASVLTALIDQRGGYVVQDATGAVYALPVLTPEQADDPELVVLLDYAAAADVVREAGTASAAGKTLSAAFANQRARGLL